jgi:hypothetical protein
MHTTSSLPAPSATPSLFTNHGLVLLHIAVQPGARTRDIALLVGITERSAQRIVGDLVTAGVLGRRRNGRRNVYEIDVEATLSDPLWAGLKVRELLHFVTAAATRSRPRPAPDGRVPAGECARLAPSYDR